MLAAYCPEHRTRVLVSLDDVIGLRRVADGFVVRFTCPCGLRVDHHEESRAS
jgi:hypothetical protein